METFKDTNFDEFEDFSSNNSKRNNIVNIYFDFKDIKIDGYGAVKINFNDKFTFKVKEIFVRLTKKSENFEDRLKRFSVGIIPEWKYNVYELKNENENDELFINEGYGTQILGDILLKEFFNDIRK